MRLSINRHACPRLFLRGDFNLRNLRIVSEKMFSRVLDEFLDRFGRILLCQDEDRVPHRVCGENVAIFSSGVRGSEVALEADIQSHVLDLVPTVAARNAHNAHTGFAVFILSQMNSRCAHLVLPLCLDRILLRLSGQYRILSL